MSRRGHNQLSALKPLFGVACPLWWNKEVDARQHLHGLPPMIGWCVSDQNHILASSRPSHGMSRVGRGDTPGNEARFDFSLSAMCPIRCCATLRCRNKLHRPLGGHHFLVPVASIRNILYPVI
jgi:hypothetical protein